MKIRARTALEGMFECIAESGSGSLGQFTLGQGERSQWNRITRCREQHGTGDCFLGIILKGEMCSVECLCNLANC